MSLRARLSVVLVSLVAGALLVTGVVTYASLRSFLIERVDEQLQAARAPVARALLESRNPFGFRGTTGLSLPPGTYGELRDPAGATVTSVVFVYQDEAPDPRPALGDGSLPTDEPFTVQARGGGDPRYRALATALPTGGTIVVAIPLSEVAGTMARLLAILLAAAAAVLIGLAVVARALIRRELRPLERIGETAGAIAAGDLSQRIEPTDERSEVGRLGVSLNAMLAQIERAFADKEASEDRLRRFLADASHELRTPLTSIRGYAELFRRGADARPDDLAKAMRRIEEEAARMGLLVDDLLLLARLDQGRPLERAPVDLATIAADVVADARAIAPERSIDLDVAGACQIEGDETRLRQVASNLVTNALVHTPDGTPVRVRVAIDGNQAVLEVSDDGPGIPPDQLELVFDRFHRVGARAEGAEGAGLGLSIAAAIARAHGGDIRLQSEPGHGATFRVLIPIERVPAPAA